MKVSHALLIEGIVIGLVAAGGYHILRKTYVLEDHQRRVIIILLHTNIMIKREREGERERERERGEKERGRERERERER